MGSDLANVIMGLSSTAIFSSGQWQMAKKGSILRYLQYFVGVPTTVGTIDKAKSITKKGCASVTEGSALAQCYLRI